MTAYTEFSPAPQHFVDGAEDLHMGEIVSRLIETEAFLSKLDREDIACTRLRNAVCLAFEREKLTAKDAIEILMSENIWGNREYFMAVYAAGVRALAERLPEAPLPPSLPPSWAPGGILAAPVSDIAGSTPVSDRLIGHSCPSCKNTGHVCENHPNRSWDDCECGAGMPCPKCCSPIPEDGTGSIADAFVPDHLRARSTPSEYLLDVLSSARSLREVA